MLEVNCAYSEIINIEKLKKHPRNRNKHKDKQVKLLSKLIEQNGWRHPVIVSKQTGYIIAGHGRVLAAKELGLTQIPVDYQDFKNAAEEYRILIADNEIARYSEFDNLGFLDDLNELGLGHNYEDFGLLNFKVSDINEKYSTKIESPIYTPKGNKPKLKELFKLKKYNEIIKEIDNSSVDEDIKEFLKLAATRHIIFNYELIAEYYAHTNSEVKELMENSALIIIDFNKAIEKGFIKLNKTLQRAFNE